MAKLFKDALHAFVQLFSAAQPHLPFYVDPTITSYYSPVHISALVRKLQGVINFQISLQPAAALHGVRVPGLSAGADRAHGHPAVRHGALQRRPRLCHDGALATVRVPGKCSWRDKTFATGFT